MSFLSWRQGPSLDAVVQMGPQESRAEKTNHHLPLHAVYSSFDAAQDTWPSRLQAHSLAFWPEPEVFPHGFALKRVHLPDCTRLGLPQPQCSKHFALALVESHLVCISWLLKPVQVPLNCILSFYHVNCTTQFGVICKCAEDILNPTVCVADNAQSHCLYCWLRC